MQNDFVHSVDFEGNYQIYNMYLSFKYTDIHKDNVNDYLDDLERLRSLTIVTRDQTHTPLIQEMHDKAIQGFTIEIARVKDLIINDELPNADGTYDSNKNIYGEEQ